MGGISSFGFIDGLPLGLGCTPKIPLSKYCFCHAAIRLGLSKLNNSVNDTLRMYKNDDIRMYNFDCITDTIVEVITTCNTYTLLTVHLL